jgi:hypothetical protein
MHSDISVTLDGRPLADVMELDLTTGWAVVLVRDAQGHVQLTPTGTDIQTEVVVGHIQVWRRYAGFHVCLGASPSFVN